LAGKLTNHKKDIIKWKLKTYVDVDGERILAKWYSGLSFQMKARFQTRVWHLIQQDRDGWTRPQFDTLSDEAQGFGEIRMGRVEGLQTRLIGFFHLDAFVVVVKVTKKGGKYDPTNWVNLIKQRRQEVINDPGKANEWIPQAPMAEPQE
jgi:phage-related protein